MILGNGAHEITEHAARIRRILQNLREPSGGPIQPHESVPGAHPKIADAVFEDRADVVAAVRAGIGASRVVADECSVRRVQAVEAAPRTHPECAIAILIHATDAVVAQAPVI